MLEFNKQYLEHLSSTLTTGTRMTLSQYNFTSVVIGSTLNKVGGFFRVRKKPQMRFPSYEKSSRDPL